MKSYYERVRDTAKQAVNGVRQGFRAILTSITPGTPVQLVQAEALKDEQLEAAELFQHFGFTSTPPAGTQLVVLPLGGQTAHSVVVATEHGAYRLAVKQGEVCVYSQWGSFIKLKEGRIIEAECDEMVINTKTYRVNASELVHYATPSYSMSGASGGAADARIEGKLWASEDLKAQSVSLVAHVHRNSGGSGNSGTPVN